MTDEDITLPSLLCSIVVFQLMKMSDEATAQSRDSGSHFDSESASGVSNKAERDGQDPSVESDVNSSFASCHINDSEASLEQKPEIANDSTGDEALDWFVNEDYIRDQDKELTDEDKQERRKNSEKLKQDGNELFKKASCEEAARCYTAALRICPFTCKSERAILYSNRAACFLHMNKKEEGIMDCTKALEYNSTFLKVLLRRALLYEKAEKLDEALEDYKKALEMDPRNDKAMEACHRLPEQINERNEKMKQEMLGKLKDLGNMILKPFGLSTDHFRMQQDPTTGSYSISMQQKK